MPCNGVAQPQNAPLLVFGYGARIFDDPTLAARIDEGQFLIPWKASATSADAEECLLIGRYDVRHMLDSLLDMDCFDTEFERSGALVSDIHQASSTESLLEDELEMHQMRYDGICVSDDGNGSCNDNESACSDGDSSTSSHDAENKNLYKHDEHSGKRWKWSYKETAESDDTARIPHKPTSTRQIEIMQRTTQFIVKAFDPVQAEIMIQTKQSSNSDFSFMHKHNLYYSYFEQMKALMKMGLWQYVHTQDVVKVNQAMGDHPKKHIDEALKRKVSEQLPHTSLANSFVGDIPASDVAVIVQRTADFVKRNGIQFEQVLMTRNSHDPRFSFLKPWNRFYGYYKSCLSKDELDGTPLVPLLSAIKEQPVSQQKSSERRKRAKLFLTQLREAHESVGDDPVSVVNDEAGLPVDFLSDIPEGKEVNATGLVQYPSDSD